jgi:hypothetical protein
VRSMTSSERPGIRSQRCFIVCATAPYVTLTGVSTLLA